MLDNFLEKEINWTREANSNDGEKFSNKSITGSKVEILRKTNKIYNKFPFSVRKALGYLKCSPRHILQNTLSFWQPKDPASFKKMNDQINTMLQDDWQYVERMKISY